MRANYNNYSDEQLAVLFNQKDRSAFETIYGRYKDLLYVHAKKMLKDHELAKDVVQELFAGLFLKMGSLELKSTIKSYLYHLIRNRVLDLIKHQKVKLNYVESMQTYQQQHVANADYQILEKEFIQTIEKEIDLLPPKMKAIFEMSRKKHLSNMEIAKATETTEENVRRQLRIALTRLKSRLSCYILMQIMTSIVWFNRTF